MLGPALVQQYPEDFSAYIGFGQAVNMRENEQYGFEKLSEIAANSENLETIKRLAPHPPAGPFDENFITQLAQVRQWQVRYGLAMGSDLRTIWRIATSPFYSLRERLAFAALGESVLDYQAPIFRAMFDDIDVRDFGLEFEIPIFIIMGDRDYQTPHTLARAYFEEISAPYKAFFLIEDGGHGAHHDNPAAFNRVLIEEVLPVVK